MSASKEFNNRRAQFMKLAAADDLPASLVKLAYLIAYKEIDLKTQTTRRTHATLATRMGVTPRTIQRLLAIPDQALRPRRPKRSRPPSDGRLLDRPLASGKYDTYVAFSGPKIRHGKCDTHVALFQ